MFNWLVSVVVLCMLIGWLFYIHISFYCYSDRVEELVLYEVCRVSVANNKIKSSYESCMYTMIISHCTFIVETHYISTVLLSRNLKVS